MKYEDKQLSRYGATIDHIQPKAMGGTDDPDNLLPCCKWCNEIKGAKSIEEFRRALLDNAQEWQGFDEGREVRLEEWVPPLN